MLSWIKAHPAVVASGSVALAALLYALYKASGPVRVFKDEAGSGGAVHAAAMGIVDEEEEAIFKAGFDEAKEALIELGATGVFSEAEGITLTREFIAKAHELASVHTDGVPQLDATAFRTLLAHAGVDDAKVADRMFALWDADHTGTINMKEFMSAIILMSVGSLPDKLHAIFTMMDLNNDGTLTKAEVYRFMRIVARLNSEKITSTELQAQVDAVFAASQSQRFGLLSREEFLRVASQRKFHLGERLAKFMNTLQARFTHELSSPTVSSPVPSGVELSEVQSAVQPAPAVTLIPSSVPASPITTPPAPGIVDELDASIMPPAAAAL